MPQPCTYHFHPRVGAYCIRPTDVFGRKRMPCICVIHFRMYAGFVRFCVIRARVHETAVRFCTYSPRSGSFVGRIQYAPTRGHKMVMRFCGIRFRGHKMVMHIGLSLFFGRKKKRWTRRGCTSYHNAMKPNKGLVRTQSKHIPSYWANKRHIERLSYSRYFVIDRGR